MDISSQLLKVTHGECMDNTVSSFGPDALGEKVSGFGSQWAHPRLPDGHILEMSRFGRWCRRKSQPSNEQGSALRLHRSLMEEQLLLQRDDSCPYGVSAQTGRAAWLPLTLVGSLCLSLETCIDVTFNRIPHTMHLVEWAEVTYPSCLRAVRRVLVKIELPEDDWLYEWAHKLYTCGCTRWRSFANGS